MKAWTAHTKEGREPILVKEGFSWLGFLFGPLWFAARRAWVPAAIHLLLLVLLLRVVPVRGGGVILFGLAVLAGLLGRDLVRWSLEQRGYTMVHVLMARDEETAMGRLLTVRPDIVATLSAKLTADLAATPL